MTPFLSLGFPICQHWPALESTVSALGLWDMQGQPEMSWAWWESLMPQQKLMEKWGKDGAHRAVSTEIQLTLMGVCPGIMGGCVEDPLAPDHAVCGSAGQ